MTKHKQSHAELPKSPTGIRGLDEITNGGLPRGRPTLICGPAGCGKTLLSMEFLVRGVREYGENGVFMTFEETGADLTDNVGSLGFDVGALIAAGKLLIDHVHIEPSEFRETGEYNLEGLFIRLDHAITSIGTKRVVLDTVEALFSGLPNPAVLRAELRRLFRWLKDKGVTAIITGERGENTLTRYGIEEYVSDCVIVLDHRVNDQMSTRRLRIAKYRGSSHGTNEYPFLIDENGILILPLSSMNLAHQVSAARIPSGIARLDSMLGGEGYYSGSSILVSGTGGSGKTSIAAHFVDAACRRGERCLYFLFEESPEQVMRNMRSIGIDLRRWAKRGLLQFHAARPSLTGLEMHLAVTLKAIRDFEPRVVVIDPISAFAATGDEREIKSMLMRVVDFLKTNGMTALFTSLTADSAALDLEHTNFTSLIDTWLLLRDIEQDGERNRAVYVMKSRGMKNSNQVREFVLTSQGVELMDVYVGPAGVLVGSARLKRELLEKNEATAARQESALKKNDLERKRSALQNQIAALQDDIRAAELESSELERQTTEEQSRAAADRISMGNLRKADASGQAGRRLSKIERNDEKHREKEAGSEGNGQSGRRRMGAATLRRRSNAKVRNGVR
ncbi:MAG TPA: circadian clock protein KaiC [Thermoanaerobaculia bacterium]|nr:circadian clock protein KaiC [Thermoanaerobaculia bacterium]